MNRLNFFNSSSPFFPFRWLIVITLALGSFMFYADATGMRFFPGSGQEQWSATGPGYHK